MTTLIDPTGQEISTSRPLIGGEWVRWIVGLGLAALVAWFTTQNAMDAKVAAIKATQESQFGELLRRMDVLQADIRELRQR
jgi:hypothetical protein